MKKQLYSFTLFNNDGALIKYEKKQKEDMLKIINNHFKNNFNSKFIINYDTIYNLINNRGKNYLIKIIIKELNKYTLDKEDKIINTQTMN